MAIHLCGLPGDVGRAARPTLGLAPGGVCRAVRVTPGAGALLPHRFTLTCAARSPGWPSAVCFLWHFPAGRPDWPLASTLPCGAPTFLSLAAEAAEPRPPGRLTVAVDSATSRREGEQEPSQLLRRRRIELPRAQAEHIEGEVRRVVDVFIPHVATSTNVPAGLPAQPGAWPWPWPVCCWRPCLRRHNHGQRPYPGGGPHTAASATLTRWPTTSRVEGGGACRRLHRCRGWRHLQPRPVRAGGLGPGRAANLCWLALLSP